MPHNFRMRIIIFAAMVLLAFAGPATADQNDPRLDNLFSILQTSDEHLEVRAAENLIWNT